VARMSYHRVALLVAGLALAFGLTGTVAPAALDMYVGARTIVKSEPLSDCNTKAKSALNAVLENALEADDTGQWQAYGTLDSSGHSSAAAAIHCYPVDNGYLVTFTCAVQAPPNPDTASALCAKVAAAFGAKAAAFDAPVHVVGVAPH
jgi:hypothetical protein